MPEYRDGHLFEIPSGGPGDGDDEDQVALGIDAVREPFHNNNSAHYYGFRRRSSVERTGTETHSGK